MYVTKKKQVINKQECPNGAIYSTDCRQERTCTYIID